MSTCYLCNVLKEKKYILWENDLLFASFDTCPVSPGHILLVTKRHINDFSKLSEREYLNIRSAIKEIIPIIESTDLVKIYNNMVHDHESDQSVWFCQKALSHPKINNKPEGYNHGFNDGKAAGRTVNHFHWHIIPRYQEDNGIVGGIRFVIPEMGDYKKLRK